MATPFVLTNAKIYLDGYDLSGRSNSVSIGYDYDRVPAVTFGDEVRHDMVGLPSLSVEAGGLAVTDGTDDSEDVIAAKLAVVNTPVSIGYSGADGTPGYFTKAMLATNQLGGQLGEAFSFRVTGCSQGYKLIRGYYLAPRLSRTSSTSGTVKAISAVTATQKVYSLLQVFAVSGTSPTLDVIVASDEAVGFSSPATRITHAQKAAIGSELSSADGAVTDTYWRVSWTIGGTSTPTFDFAVTVGII